MRTLRRSDTGHGRGRVMRGLMSGPAVTTPRWPCGRSSGWPAVSAAARPRRRGGRPTHFVQQVHQHEQGEGQGAQHPGGQHPPRPEFTGPLAVAPLTQPQEPAEEQERDAEQGRPDEQPGRRQESFHRRAPNGGALRRRRQNDRSVGRGGEAQNRRRGMKRPSPGLVCDETTSPTRGSAAEERVREPALLPPPLLRRVFEVLVGEGAGG